MHSTALRHRQAKLEARAAREAEEAAAGPRGPKAGKGRDRLRGNQPPQVAPVNGEMALANPYSGEAGKEYQLLLIQLHEDLRALSNIQSIEGKIAAKPAMLAKYEDWIQRVLATPEGEEVAQDEILVTGLVWALDTGNWVLGLDIADFCIEHSLSLPERYERTLPCLVVEEIADKAIAEPGSVTGEFFVRAAPIVALDMPDQVKAKYFRAVGEDLARTAETFDTGAENAVAGGKPALIEAALTALRRAVQLNPKVGVKKEIERLDREAKKLAEAAQEQT